MSTGVRRRTGASRNQDDKLELQGDELKAFSEEEEELRRRPEVTIINNYAVVVAYIRIGLKGIGALALLWATVVLLGGFISELKGEDFRTVTIIAFLQAAGLAGGVLDDRVSFLWVWLVTLYQSTKSLGEKHRHRGTLYIREWLDRPIHKAMRLTVVIILFPLASFALSGPSICIALSVDRLPVEDKYIGDGDASKNINIKLALKIFYYMSVAHGATSILFTMIELVANVLLVKIVSRQYGFRTELLDGYLRQTMKMCVNNPASTENWNLITYGAALLDSHLPEDYVSGGRVLTMLIDQDIPVPITWLLIRSPRQRIQKLIGTLAWRNPAEQEMRWLAARIVEHLAGDLSLAQFPGALECISSLLDTPYRNNGDQEVPHLPFVIEHSKPRYKTGSCFKLCPITKLGQYGKKSENGEGIDVDLVFPCLRILENLAHDRHNCTLIYNTKDLLSKIVAPVSSKELVQDMKSNAAWTKVVDGSLKVVSRLMGSSGSTGLKMCKLIANNSSAVNNLEAVMCMDTERNSGVIDLQIRAIEVLTPLVLHHPTSFAMVRREKLIERMLRIFATKDCMEGYLKEEKSRMLHQNTGQWTNDYLKEENSKMQHQMTSQQNTLPRQSTGTRMDSYVRIVSVVCPSILSVGGEARVLRAAEARLTMTRATQARMMKEAQESASRLKEKAGEALAMLSSDPEVITSFTTCKNVHVHFLTELLDSNIKAIECQISSADIVQMEVNISCRLSAAVILKHLSNYNMEPTLRKVLAELLPVRQAQASSTPRYWECLFPICCRNDIENPSDRGQDESSASQSHHIQQCNENRLQAELLSLAAAILANSNFNFADILICPPASDTLLDDFVVRLKKMVEDNMYGTPASLAIQKLTCKMVIGFLQHDQNVKVIDSHNIVGTILEASKAMAGLESSMLFSGVDRDCHGVPLKPLSSVLAKRAQDLLTQKKHALDINIAPGDVPVQLGAAN